MKKGKTNLAVIFCASMCVCVFTTGLLVSVSTDTQQMHTRKPFLFLFSLVMKYRLKSECRPVYEIPKEARANAYAHGHVISTNVCHHKRVKPRCEYKQAFIDIVFYYNFKRWSFPFKKII